MDADESWSDPGPCCICEATGPQVRTLIALTARSPLGRGWGCAQCGLASVGAMAVICAACAARYQPGEQWHVELDLRWACRGYPGSDGRIRFEELRGEHVHIRSKHPDELPPIPPLTVVPSDTRFDDHVEEGRGCFCSRCGQTIHAGTLAIRAWPAQGTWALRYHPVCFGAMPSPEDPYAEDDWGPYEEPWEEEEDSTDAV